MSSGLPDNTVVRGDEVRITYTGPDVITGIDRVSLHTTDLGYGSLTARQLDAGAFGAGIHGVGSVDLTRNGRLSIAGIDTFGDGGSIHYGRARCAMLHLAPSTMLADTESLLVQGIGGPVDPQGIPSGLNVELARRGSELEMTYGLQDLLAGRPSQVDLFVKDAMGNVTSYLAMPATNDEIVVKGPIVIIGDIIIIIDQVRDGRDHPDLGVPTAGTGIGARFATEQTVEIPDPNGGRQSVQAQEIFIIPHAPLSEIDWISDIVVTNTSQVGGPGRIDILDTPFANARTLFVGAAAGHPQGPTLTFDGTDGGADRRVTAHPGQLVTISVSDPTATLLAYIGVPRPLEVFHLPPDLDLVFPLGPNVIPLTATTPLTNPGLAGSITFQAISLNPNLPSGVAASNAGILDLSDVTAF